MRIWMGLAGLIAGIIAIVGPVLFIANELQEIQSAKQYGAHISISILAALGVCILVFGLSASFGFGAYLLLRRALTAQG